MHAIAFTLGSFNIYWYSIILLIGFSAGGLLALKESKKKNISRDLMLDYFLYLIPIVLIGARLYYVLFEFDYYISNLFDIFKVWEGGLAIHGGVIAGTIYTVYFTNKNKLDFFEILDIMVVSLIIGQVIGRWGNFMNQEAYGPITTLKFLQEMHLPKFIIDGMLINGHYYQPTFLYESIWNLIGFIILIIMRKIKYIKIGEKTSFYLVWYGFGRFIIESLRQDSLMLANVKMAQLVSLIMIFLGFVVFEYSIRKKDRIEEVIKKNKR